MAVKAVSIRIVFNTVFKGSETGIVLGKSESDLTLDTDSILFTIFVAVSLIFDTNSKFGSQMISDFTLKTFFSGFLNGSTVFDHTDVVFFDIGVSTLGTSLEIVLLATWNDASSLVAGVLDEGEVA